MDNINTRKIYFYHATHFEEWEPSTPDTRGIGNSETCQIELCKRLAKRGWDVTSYAPVPWKGMRRIDGVNWGHLEDVDWSRPGVWMLFRRPEDLDNFPLPHPGQRCFIVAQDESFQGRWNEERVAKADGVFGLCKAHCSSLKADATDVNVLQSSNGIKMNLIREIDKEQIDRDPHRIVWASSPDRGLLNLLKIFRRIREWVSDATLHCYYGFDNIDKLIALSPNFERFKKIKADILEAANQPGVVWHGRLSQPELLREFRRSAVMVYPSTFRETSCAVHQECQAMGVIPVVSPIWALAENTIEGSFVIGDPDDPLTQARFVWEVCRWIAFGDKEEIEKTRRKMMESARLSFNWERQVDKYEGHIFNILGIDREVYSQFNFQIKACLGVKSILNVGCADDPAKLKSLGSINLDARREDPIFHRLTAADLVLDCRKLPGLLRGQFERVVCGDMLEHFPVKQVPPIIRKLRDCLSPTGSLVLTIPDDQRPTSQQHSASDGSHEYSPGVSACHTHRIPKELVYQWIEDAGMQVDVYQEIDCHWYFNHGVIASRKPIIPEPELKPKSKKRL